MAFTLMQNLDKLSAKLENERKRAVLELEIKMKRRKQQHERNLEAPVSTASVQASHS